MATPACGPLLILTSCWTGQKAQLLDRQSRSLERKGLLCARLTWMPSLSSTMPAVAQTCPARETWAVESDSAPWQWPYLLATDACLSLSFPICKMETVTRMSHGQASASSHWSSHLLSMSPLSNPHPLFFFLGHMKQVIFFCIFYSLNFVCLEMAL